jgi:hypothetical protein
VSERSVKKNEACLIKSEVEKEKKEKNVESPGIELIPSWCMGMEK